MKLSELITSMIDKETPQFAEGAAKLFRNFHDGKITKEEFIQKLVELFYEYIERVMSNTLKYLYGEYEVEAKPLSREELTSMFYSKDGKTFYDRIKEYVEKDDLTTFIYNFYRFLRTETVVVMNSVSFHKLKDLFKYVRIVPCNCCGGCDELMGVLATWTLTENVSVNDLPPLHPECHCGLEYAHEKPKTSLS